VKLREVNCSFETVVSGLQTTVLVVNRKPSCRYNRKQEANPSSLCVKRRMLSGCDALLCFVVRSDPCGVFVRERLLMAMHKCICVPGYLAVYV
jgi:hypothetical protein